MFFFVVTLLKKVNNLCDGLNSVEIKKKHKYVQIPPPEKERRKGFFFPAENVITVCLHAANGRGLMGCDASVTTETLSGSSTALGFYCRLHP